MTLILQNVSLPLQNVTKRINAMTEKKTLKEKEAAVYIGMSQSFLRQDRMNGYRKNRTKGPSFVQIGRTIRYSIEDLDEWIKKHRVVRNDPVLNEDSF